MDFLTAAESHRTSSAYLAGSVSSPIVDYVTSSQWVWPDICLASRHVFVYVLLRQATGGRALNHTDRLDLT